MEGKRTRVKKDVQESPQEKPGGAVTSGAKALLRAVDAVRTGERILFLHLSQGRHRHLDALLVDDRGHAETTWFVFLQTVAHVL